MIEQSPRTAKVNFLFRQETRELLDILTKIHDRSMTSVLEQLVKKEAKEHGLIDSRD